MKFYANQRENSQAVGIIKLYLLIVLGHPHIASSYGDCYWLMLRIQFYDFIPLDRVDSLMQQIRTDEIHL